MALHLLSKDRDVIQRSFDSMEKVKDEDDPMAEAQADAAFQLAIARASHNAVIYSVMPSMFEPLRASISENLAKLYTVPRVRDRVLEQDQCLMDTILVGNADEMRKSSDTHIEFIEITVRGLGEERERVARAAAFYSSLGRKQEQRA